MRRQLRGSAKKYINGILDRLDLELVHHGNGNFDNYIPFRTTLAGAKEAGLGVGDYIDKVHNVPGATQQTLDKMANLGVFQDPIEQVVEIGPGSGRYLDKTIQRCHPKGYTVYETAKDWRDWLAQTYPITAHEADGSTLAYTATQSVDLVHAHKVLPGLPIFVTCRYFEEMARVTRINGKIVFDVLTEQCLDDDDLNKWFASGAAWVKSMIPKNFAVDFFARRGFVPMGSFNIVMLPAITEYLVFKRVSGDVAPKAPDRLRQPAV